VKRNEKILILDANQRSALAATRSLGKKGLVVICADDCKKALSSASKYSYQSLIYPSPYTCEKEFIDYISQNLKSLGIRYLLPMTDITAELILKNRSKLHNVIILLPDYQPYLSVTDKYDLFDISLKRNIPIPRTIFIKQINDVTEKIKDLKYPVVIKPGRSIVYVNGIYQKTTVRYANTEEDLFGIINKDPWFRNNKYLIQEYIKGHGEGLFLLCDKGKIRYYFSHERIREKPPSGGVSVLSESINTRDECLAIAQKILEPLEWNGVAMVEFKVTEENQPYLMEINGRFWGSLQLAIDSGMNFPILLFNQFSSNEGSVLINEYKTGLQLRWLLGDLDNLIITLRDSEISNSKKLSTMIRFFYLYKKNQFYEVNRFEDIKPAIREFRQYIRALFY
jgi:predicted ATP-grasp superfamily ATP-dependent carboligase